MNNPFTGNNLTRGQYWIIIFITFGLLIINGYLVWNLIHNKIEFDKTCPIPKDEINFCECIYNAISFTQGKELKYCICYPEDKIDFDELIKSTYEFNYSNFSVENIFKNGVLNGTRGDS